ncbi:MAG: zinc ABC transporter solute-binding protein [Chloroflexi bacterium]|nr:zinc ABC transporter solute-binding protein [Chloroflexota bacterium]
MNTIRGVIGLSVVLVLAACSTPAADESGDITYPINAVATIGQIADVVRNVGGETVDVTLLLGEGIDPHTYQPIEADLEALQGADIIFYNALNLEAQLGPVIEQLGSDRGIPVISVEDIVAEDLVFTTDEGEPDPHLWGDLSRWALVTQGIGDALAEFDPANAETYRANAAEYAAQLETVHEWAQEAYNSLPEDQRRLVTAHDAFEYTAAAYDLDVFSPQGISTESEASVADIQAAVDYVVSNDVPAIFFENTIPVDTVEAIIEGARDQGHDVTLGGELYSDAMGPAGTPAGTYIGMQRHNVETIVRALGGDVPEWPLE